MFQLRESHLDFLVPSGEYIDAVFSCVRPTCIYSTGQKKVKVPNRSGTVPTPYLKRTPTVLRAYRERTVSELGANRDRTMSEPRANHERSTGEQCVSHGRTLQAKHERTEL